MGNAQLHQSALERYNTVARELSGLYRERGDLLGATLRARNAAYQQATIEGAGVTNARHAADMAGEHYTIESMKIDGDISACEIELRYLDRYLEYVGSIDA